MVDADRSGSRETPRDSNLGNSSMNSNGQAAYDTREAEHGREMGRMQHSTVEAAPTGRHAEGDLNSGALEQHDASAESRMPGRSPPPESAGTVSAIDDRLSRVGANDGAQGELNRPTRSSQELASVSSTAVGPDARVDSGASGHMPPNTMPPSTRTHGATVARGATMPGPGDDEGSSTSSQASPDITSARSRVGRLGSVAGRGFEEGGTVDDELELSVPSHQEHLTADGQRWVQPSAQVYAVTCALYPRSIATLSA